MAHALVVVTFPHDSGMPKDVSVNTWAVNTQSFSVATAGPPISAILNEFYSDTAVNHTIDYYFSSVLAGTYDIVCYDRSDPEPRAPKFEDLGIAMSGSFPGSSTPLPSEVSVCNSFQAAQISGTPQARRRGRNYIGPLNVNAALYTSGVARPHPDLIEDLVFAAERLNDAFQVESMRWAVWSAAGSSSSDVDNGWVDNAFDTQRRRGEAATARSTWS